MRLDYMFKARLTGSFREPFSLVFVLLAIIISVFTAVIAQEKADSGLVVAIVSEDEGKFSQKLIDYLSDYESFSVREMSYDTAVRLLKQDRLEAAVVIKNGFSEKIAKGEFQDTLELMTSPSSQAPATISEPLVNSVMMLWMEELSITTTKDCLIEHGKTYDVVDEAAQREQIKKLWDSGAMVDIVRTELDGGAGTESTSGPFETCVKWYGVLCMFYLVVGASWVLDINKKTLRVRMRQMGVSQWQVVIVNSLAPLVICLTGYIAAGAACSVLTGESIVKVAAYFIPLCLYLFGLLGVTLLTASLLKNVLSLMFLAPILTFLNGVLSGLLIETPSWAYVLKWISGALPGRWLCGCLTSPSRYLPWAILCALLWMGAGIVVSSLRAKRQQF
ncbi:MAG: ABC transporter permease [Oscillospiraceae bacterium]